MFGKHGPAYILERTNYDSIVPNYDSPLIYREKSIILIIIFHQFPFSSPPPLTPPKKTRYIEAKPIIALAETQQQCCVVLPNFFICYFLIFFMFYTFFSGCNVTKLIFIRGKLFKILFCIAESSERLQTRPKKLLSRNILPNCYGASFLFFLLQTSKF